MEEIEESKDFMDNKIINSTLPSEESPIGLTGDIKPKLNSSTQNNKNKEEIPEDMFMCSILPTQEICLSIQITPASR